MDNPTNIVAGQSGSIFVTQDGTGSRTLAYGGYWDFVAGTAPVLTTTERSSGESNLDNPRISFAPPTPPARASTADTSSQYLHFSKYSECSESISQLAELEMFLTKHVLKS